MAPPEPSLTSDLVGLFRQSLSGHLVDCNDACARMLGYGSRGELLERPGFDYVTISDFPSITAALPDIGELRNVELALRRKGGAIAWVLQNLRVQGDATSRVIEGAMF